MSKIDIFNFQSNKIFFNNINKIFDIIFKVFEYNEKIIQCFKFIYDKIKKILDYKKLILKIFKNHITFYFRPHQLQIIKSWVLNHSIKFEQNNIYGTLSYEAVERYKKSNSTHNLLILEPKKNGIVYFNNTEFNYILEDVSINLFHYNKLELDNVLRNIVDSFKSLDHNNIEEQYRPKIFKPVIEEKINTVYWEENNVVFENVKLFLSDQDKKKILDPFETFYTKNEIYNHIGLTYKIASLFLGSPGLGKTTTVKYLAQKYKQNIYVFERLPRNLEHFLILYSLIPDNSIILFDDFDKTIHMFNYEFVTAFLNIFDGVQTKNGSVLIICLNDEKILEKKIPTITRVGRIDLKIDFDKFDKESILISTCKEIFIDAEDVEIQEYIKLFKEIKNLNISDLKIHCLHSNCDIKKAIKNLRHEKN